MERQPMLMGQKTSHTPSPTIANAWQPLSVFFLCNYVISRMLYGIIQYEIFQDWLFSV